MSISTPTPGSLTGHPKHTTPPDHLPPNPYTSTYTHHRQPNPQPTHPPHISHDPPSLTYLPSHPASPIRTKSHQNPACTTHVPRAVTPRKQAPAVQPSGAERLEGRFEHGKCGCELGDEGVGRARRWQELMGVKSWIVAMLQLVRGLEQKQ